MLRTLAIASTLVLGSFLSGAVKADSPSYDFFEVAYVSGDIDNPDVDGDGFSFGGSVSVHENWFLFADYTDLDFDFGVDLSLLDVGVGYRVEMSDNTDFAFTGSFVRADASGPGGSADDDGYGLSAIIRGMVNEQFELNGGISYVDLGGTDGDDTSFVLGGVYSFTDNVAFDGRIEIGDDVNLYVAGFRFYFNN
ncbi:MAG: porin [Gammaproteobacteria bacterium]|nr:porin [Gammaproteobacteria bacterium]